MEVIGEMLQNLEEVRPIRMYLHWSYAMRMKDLGKSWTTSYFL